MKLIIALLLVSQTAQASLAPPSYSTVACQKSGTWNIDSIVGTVTVSGTVGVTGVATASNQASELTKLDSLITNTGSNATAANQSTELTRLGDVTEAAPASDTASSGLNGRLQRIAQRITTLIGSTLNVAITNATLAVTQSGAWVLSAGSALIGKVGIDQTTPGTTNRVSISNDGSVTLLTGANSIGSVGLNAGSNTIGNVGLNAGSNTIGKVDQGVGGTSPWVAKQTSQTVATYWASFQTYTPVAAATNMIQLRGSATKTVRLKSLVICPSATAAGLQFVWLRKESTADTIGSAVFTSLSLAPTNSTQAAATASLGHYGTANVTTAGTLVGTMPVLRVWFEITAGTTAGIPACTDLVKATGWDSLDAAEFFTLNGTAQSISVSNNAAALAAGYKIDAYTVLFTEE